MLRKSFTAECKDVGEGTARVVIATLNAVDKDGDLTLPGAFGSQTVKILPAHDWSHPSMGVASISESGDDVTADLKFFMNMLSAKEWHLSLKGSFEAGVPQQFSYGYDVNDSSEDTIDGKRIRVLKDLIVHEVSPVVVGAGVNTRVLDVKDGLEKGLTLDEEFTRVRDGLRKAIDRSKALTALRADEGRDPSKASLDRLDELKQFMHEIGPEIDELLMKADPTPVAEKAGLVDAVSLLLELELGQAQRARRATC